MGRQHPNVLKVRKQGRMRRAYLNHYNEIKVPRSVGKSDVPEDSRALFDYRTRGSTFWSDFFTANIPTMLSKNKLEVIARAKELTKDISPECNVIVHRGGITRTITRFYFATDYSQCFFMKEDWRGMYMLKSTPYLGSGCKDRAMFDFNHSRLTWVERLDFPTVPDSPSG